MDFVHYYKNCVTIWKNPGILEFCTDKVCIVMLQLFIPGPFYQKRYTYDKLQSHYIYTVLSPHHMWVIFQWKSNPTLLSSLQNQWGKLSQRAEPSKRNIMSAILQTRGPVVEHKVVAWTWKFLKMLTVKQFLTAANELQESNLGHVVTVPHNGGRTSTVFIKQPLDEIRDALAINIDLCPLDYYDTRYKLPVSKSVSLQLRASLVQNGLVPAKLLK